MTISNNPQLQRQQEAEHQISGIPWTISSTAKSVKAHYFTTYDNIERETNFVSITNTGTSGTLYISFVSGGFSTGNNFSLAAQETFSKKLSISKVFVSGVAEVPYQIVCGLTNMENKTAEFGRFLPTDLTGVFAYWKADSGVTLSGSYVTKWTDSVNGRTLVSSGSNTPTYVSSDPYVNSRSSIKFTLLTTKMYSEESPALYSFLTSPAGSTIAVVFYTTSSALTQGICGTSIAAAAQTGKCILYQYPTISQSQTRQSISGAAVYDTITQTFSVNSLVNNAVFLISNTYSGSSGAKCTTLFSQKPYTSQSMSQQFVDATPTYSFRLSAIDELYFLRGAIAEVLIYNRTLSELEMNKLGTYFVRKYGALI